ncbi:L-lysine cyclodeaminase [Roseovarius sp. A-2]|uniref:cyclodeaminase n=1 Tax=Roseovarius sp. A-2 TaxID=1570360 RepID=UPI0009B5782C|nr:cyclodeaminase [Roseovarius sp. A-2]GAW35366.1 L-lysine cyclodeaminase [Roseovarius sp. A-2]
MAHDIRIVTEAELRTAVTLDRDTVKVIEQAFGALSDGGVVMPPVMSMDLAEAHGEVDVKSAYIPGFDGFAIKVSPGFFDNPKLGLPSLNGLMILFSAKTGLVEAVFLDNGYLTDLRTAAAGAVAAQYLAPETVQTAGVIGTGVQARLQARAACLVRPFERLLIWGRDAEKARACAGDLSDLNCDIQVVDTPAHLVRDSQLVITTTPAKAPVIKAEWLHPELHITAMGSDQAGKNEIDPQALVQADLYVADRAPQAQSLGELRAALEAGLWAGDSPVELGDVIRHRARGRRHASEVTICDLTGTGAQDTAIATHVMARLAGREVGTVIHT